MPLTVFGVNHRSAPVSIRERLALPPERLGEALEQLLAEPGVEEALVLSTCNRLEVYCARSEEDPDLPLAWLERFYGVGREEYAGYLYHYPLTQAVEHLLRVAAGLDSMVLGEPQILGQLKSAYATARERGTIGRLLDRLIQHAFATAKKVRTDTAIGNSPVSVAFAAVRLAQQIFGELERRTALLIGAGETIELAARHLHDQGIERLIVANRTLERAQHLAHELNGFAITLEEIGEHLYEADVVVASTGASEAVLLKETVEQALRRRRHRPMFLVDLAVPRDIEESVAELEDVYHYTIDDLEAVVAEGLESRRAAAAQAEEIIQAEAAHFIEWLHGQDAVSTIRALRERFDSSREEVLRRARRALERGEDPRSVLEMATRQLANKLAHAPTVRLRRALADERRELLAAARELFDLEEPD